MSRLSNFFGFSSGLVSSSESQELPDIYPMDIREVDFVRTDVQNIYSRILSDVLERTSGIPVKEQKILWDNCVASDTSDGLVTMLSKAMANKQDLFLIYKKALGVMRVADSQEQNQIKADYKASGKSDTGVFITFRNYHRSDMIKLYSALEYCTVASLSKSMKLSAAIQMKFSDLRSSVGAVDSDEVIAQAKLMAKALSVGNDIMMDAKDFIETAKPDLTATDSAMRFIINKQSFYLGLPASYISADQSKGLGDSGDRDTKAIDRGLKAYYFAVIKPAIEAIFEVTTSFRSEDFSQMDSALNTLKTFELTSDVYLSAENKQLIVNKTFGLPEDEVGDEPVAPTVPVVVNAAKAPGSTTIQ